MVLNSLNFRNYCGRDATLQQWAWSGEVEAPGCISFTSLTAPACITCPGRAARRAWEVGCIQCRCNYFSGLRKALFLHSGYRQFKNRGQKGGIIEGGKIEVRKIEGRKIEGGITETSLKPDKRNNIRA